MSTATYRGVVRSGTVVPLDPMPLAEGTEVLIAPKEEPVGTSSAILAAAATAPRVPSDWVDELENLIAQGKRAPSRDDPFQDTK
ncbi:MAG TPA: hypothetical protein VFE62_18730 [Gemmataceae bacterium]|nr:hypothetical protein [Gemmataceae bacterium]